MAMRRRLWLGLSAAVMAGCATVSPPRPADDRLAGRLSVQIAATPSSPARQTTAAFELRGDAMRGELELTTPLGTTAARARWAPGEAQLDLGQGPQRYASLDDLSRDALGEPIPLSALTDWLRGRPWAGAPSIAAADGFEQLGWQVRTSERAQGWLTARRPAAPQIVVRARLQAPDESTGTSP